MLSQEKTLEQMATVMAWQHEGAVKVFFNDRTPIGLWLANRYPIKEKRKN